MINIEIEQDSTTSYYCVNCGEYNLYGVCSNCELRPNYYYFDQNDIDYDDDDDDDDDFYEEDIFNLQRYSKRRCTKNQFRIHRFSIL